ncbi:HesA/MoeB/ThiF family protein [Desmospora profundinema]|uniref:Molybdopterin/thiamine biosynthesis adenylyltransferase n=1 Tax=Desmospora profundinema TaxID=1571184 RepID=A0ABU1IMI8_9BACL|nr:HesA/MoeB/ThiF family protein [Desmospora profundinema]MDR6225990.1 molybdopterin/thiamine biosynthesis adenylyltransferase [Desmospora profundinema]
MDLNSEEKERFGWQIMIPQFGEESQKKLKQSSALVTRVGGLGGPAALFLAMAGIGKLVLAHGGPPIMGQMNRMILARYDTVGKISPAVTASDHIKQINPTIETVVIEDNVHPSNVESMVSQVDVVLDCPPTFEERYLLNEECVRQETPMVEASVCGLDGYLTSLKPGITPCLDCLGFTSPEWKLPFPILGAVAGTIGSLAAMEAIKIITGYGTPLYNQLLVLDGRSSRTNKVKVKRNDHCQTCGKPVYIA